MEATAFTILCLFAIFSVGFSLKFSRHYNDDDEEAPRIFDYSKFLKSPYSTTVDSKLKVETLGNVFKGHIKRLKTTPNKQIDIIFLVDSSTSVGKMNFVEEIKFVKKLLSDFTVDANHTRVSVITFSSRERVIRHVDYFENVADDKHKCSLLQEDLRSIKYSGGGTYTLGALIEAKKVLKKSRPAAKKAIFLITDGFSNGGDPRPEARALRQKGIKIFTFGIQNGNVRELYDMASSPKNESTYILDSFEEFEALAKRALHEDLNTGRYIGQENRKCNRLCVGKNCCDTKASCTCGTHTGKYECMCPAGHYGNGLRGGCQECPSGTYKPTAQPGDERTCQKCPNDNHMTEPGATSVEQCVCRKGYRNFNSDGCAVLTCPKLSVPKNGYFVNDKCKNVFNAACGLRCKPGYELRGSSLRICREDGAWSGKDTQCIMKTCPALMTPKNGNMICTTDDYSFNTVCRFTCDTGYKLVGSRKRTCLAIAFWTGINTRCREITCRPLPVIRDGSIYPPACTAGDVTFGTTCAVMCHPGYSLVGPHSKQCLPEGIWTPATEASQCVDTSPPYIRCPYNIEADTDLNENTATVSWQVPLAVDNSGYVPILSSIPAVMPPEKFPVGTTKVTYIAEDLNTNKGDCHFYIVVKDKQKPTIDRCFSPLPIVSPDLYADVSWEEPLFSDNSGEDVKLRRSHAPGLFPQGITEVMYKAYDSSGNVNTCTLKINVIPHPCEYPPVPVNGNRTCYEDSQGVVCMFSCKANYDFAIKPARQYSCEFDNIWEPSDQMPISDCSALELSNEIIQPASFTFAGIVACQQRVELVRLEKDFERSVTKRVNVLCEEGVDCSIRDLETTCEETKDGGAFVVLGRDKRSADGNAEPRRRVRRFAESIVDDDEGAIVTFTYLLAGKVKENSGDTSAIKESQQKLLSVFDNIQTTLKKDAKRGDLNMEVNGKKLDIFDFAFDDKPVFSCEEGSVPLERSCAKCAVGTFFNILSKECDRCPRGTFQPEEGKLSCLYCPSNTSTLETQAVSQQNCTALCLPGTFSSTTVEPCETCRKSYYQNEYGQSTCKKCPKRHSTTRRGTMTMVDCKEKCQAGYVSKTGLAPCWACPRGTYQSKAGKTSCMQCPKHADTATNGAYDLSMCEFEQADQPANLLDGQEQDFEEELDFNGCFLDNCLNGATCVPGLGINFECVCTAGYTGVYCGQEVNECEVDPCQNGATCKDAVGDYICECLPGYAGKKCETDTDDCADVVCENEGTCVDNVDSFMCNCINGFTGKLCETDIDECSPSDDVLPCFNNGECVDKAGGFTCTCPPGVTGVQCEIDIDECLPGPCQNEATCIDEINAFRCECLPGYTGERCEEDIDECANEPCMAPAKCINLLADFSCECPRGKAGLTCDQDIDVNFQLDFPVTASVTDYAMVDMPVDLDSVTACFWMRTDDTNNQGTPFSYANAEGDNIFTLTDYDGFVLYVNGEHETTTIKANDGHWHHICVLWTANRGSWKIYMDGIPEDSNERLASGQTIKGGGKFVIGQEQDSLGGGFSSPESFVGQLTQLNVWSRELSLDDIENLRLSCEKTVADVISWTDISGHVHGAVSDTPIEFCKECPEPAAVDYGTVDHEGRVAGSIAEYSCIRGFQLAGRRERLCLVTGEWEGRTPQCTRVQCGYPGSIANGWVNGDIYTFDHRVTYVCQRRYQLVGSRTRYCGEIGFWEPEAPVCEQIQCSIPALSDNTKVIKPTANNKYKPRTRVNFECTPGNEFYTEHTSVFCQLDGTWDKSIPSCDPQKCQIPLRIENGNFDNPADLVEFAVGAMVGYTCDYGFKFSTAITKIACLASGEWEFDLPTCSVIECKTPSLIAHGDYAAIGGFTFLQQLTYTCHPGYELSHTEILECYEDAEWSHAAPKCNPVRCDRPDDVLHGFFEGKADDFSFSDIITYKCNLGYQLVGESDITCTQDSTWSGTAPACKPISCGQPAAIVSGNIIGRDFTLNNIVRYACDSGYTLVGAEERVCRETGQWQNNAPVCERVECITPATVANGFYRGNDFLFEDSVTYECEHGFRLEGTAILKCMANAQWSDVEPYCESIVCELPPFVLNARVNNPHNRRLFRIADTVSYTCTAGYELSINSLNPTGEIECLDTGLWEANLPECLIVSCVTPPPILNGAPQYEEVFFKSVVRYECNEGFHLDGTAVQSCRADGAWSDAPPTCSAIECKAPEYVPNGLVDFKDLKLGSVIRYKCNDGHTLEGLEVRRCLANLSWSGEEPVCQPIDCGQPTTISNGEIFFEDILFQATVTYACDVGYTRSGERLRNCQADGKWSGEAPTCEIVQCDKPSDIISNGRMLGDVYTYGSVISYECDLGYYIDGVTNNRTCLHTGEWDRPIIVCTAVECPRLSVRNGQTSGFQTEYGTTLTVSCKRGYRLTGSAERTCLQDGSWAGEQTICVKYACPRLTPPDNGEVFVQASSIASYACLEGYNLNGKNMLTCQDDDTWSDAPPTCDAITCEDISLREFLDGTMIYESFHFQSTVVFECDPGYSLHGARRTECSADGSWSSGVPRCEKISCFLPYEPAYSRLIGDDLSYGSSVTYVCQDGFKVIGKTTRTCQADMTWSGTAPVCEAIICPRPEPAQNVIVIGVDYSYGSVLEYICNQGNQLQGPKIRNCTSTGEWSGPEPSCTLNECPRTEDLQNGRVIAQGFGAGSEVSFQCNEGYALVGLPFKLCLSSSLIWSNADPTCTRIKCPSPASISNGFFTGDSFFYLDAVEYKCNDGYKLAGQTRSICLPGGQWSQVDVECLKVSCGKPLVPNKAIFALPGNREEGEYNDMATMSCVEGYVGRGVHQRRCQADGTWTSSNFDCEIAECPEFRPVANGHFKSTGLTYGSVVDVRCDEGFYLLGKASRKCDGDGNWDDEFEPYCEQIQCPELPRINNGRTEGTDRTPGSIARHVCDAGFRLQGTERRVCQKDGTWSGTDPYCRLVICEVPPYVQFAEEFGALTQYLYNSEARYVCQRGYTITAGDRTVVCSESGTWSGTLPTCSLVQCGDPVEPANSKALVPSRDYGSEAQYICYPGYRLKGSEKITCDENGDWKGSIPECVPIDCGEPPYVVNSVTTDTGDHTYNSQVTYTCDKGFRLDGQQATKCLATGVWSGQPPLCEPISCDTPPEIKNAVHTGQSYNYKDLVTYACNEGYSISGNTVLQCHHDESWQGERPECHELTCGPPPVFQRASTTMTGGTDIGGIASFKCNSGYYLVGSATAACLENLQWNYEGDLPSCVPKDCGLPPQVIHGKVIFSSTTFQSSVIFSCDVGYTMVVEGRLVCDQTGHWSGTVAECDPVDCGLPHVGNFMFYRGNVFKYGNTIEYECLVGFSMIGESTSECKLDGVWSNQEPHCDKITCEELALPSNGITLNGRLKDHSEYGDTILLGCSPGYTLVGTGSLECMETGHWSSNLPTCRPDISELRCSPSIGVANSRSVDDFRSIGSRATVQCEAGYTGRGDMTVVCTPGQTWSAPEGHCDRVFCGKPRLRDFVNVVRVSGASYFYGDQMTYRCRAGVLPARSPPAITCLADGTWDGDIACGVTCKRPCQHGGICLGLNRCKCPAGYGGPVCEHAICILPCLNGGRCTAPYQCTCPVGYEGVRCQKAVCEKKCANGGKCVKPNKCRCRYGYSGAFCNVKRLLIK